MFIRCQVSLNRDGGLPEDQTVNVWHFDGDDTVDAHLDDLHDRLVTFYQSLSAQPWWAGSLAGTGVIKMYDMENPPHTPPVHEETFTMAVGTSSLPAELAVCLSFQGALTTSEPMNRRRGRIYLGPFSQQALLDTAGTRKDVLVSPELVAAITDGAAALAVSGVGSLPRLAVYSPTKHKGRGATSGGAPGGPGPLPPLPASDLDTAFEDVVTGWVDNAWDIQRRRGSRPTIRTAWTPDNP